MASIIPGYNYDIFISYRQKDNKHDGWVTQFVDNLKGELESTFKEEISVYFDINPHDGLLETHDVDESLKEKLKCLIFIPIISLTYCDPKAFAWEHEFKVFVDHASKDHYGLKVKLPNGNVANRVLPVQIHDLDTVDISMCESVIGSVLRGIEFIYKSAGVNRPLLPKEENPQDNLNHTNYRDQINKVANAVKEIITAIKHYSPQQDEVTQEVSKPITTPQKNNKTPIIIISIAAIAMIVLGILFIPKLFKPSEELEKSIAVLPFFNDSPSDSNTYFINGLMDELLNNLQRIKSFSKVSSRTSTEKYRGIERPSIPEISKELGVNYLIEGSGQKYGNNYRLRIQLIEGRSDKHLWAESYEKEIHETRDIFVIQSQIAHKIATELNAAISPEENELIKEIPTKNLVAYELYLLGRDRLRNHISDDDCWKAIEYFNQAVDLDTTFALAYSELAVSYYMLINYAIESPKEVAPKVIENCTKALKLNENLAYTHYLLGVILLNFKNDILGAENEYIRALELDARIPEAHLSYARLLSITGRHKDAISHADYALEVDPLNLSAIRAKAHVLFKAGYRGEAIKLLTDAHEMFPTIPYIYWDLALLYTSIGKYEDALSALKTQLTLMKGDNISDEIGLRGYLYGKLGRKDEAQEQLLQLNELSSKGYYVAPRTLVWIYLGLDKVDEAVRIIEEGISEHLIGLTFLLNYPQESFKNDPRYISYLELLHWKK